MFLNKTQTASQPCVSAIWHPTINWGIIEICGVCVWCCYEVWKKKKSLAAKKKSCYFFSLCFTFTPWNDYFNMNLLSMGKERGFHALFAISFSMERRGSKRPVSLAGVYSPGSGTQRSLKFKGLQTKLLRLLKTKCFSLTTRYVAQDIVHAFWRSSNHILYPDVTTALVFCKLTSHFREIKCD